MGNDTETNVETNNKQIQQQIADIDQAINDLANTNTNTNEPFDNGPVQNFNNLFADLQNTFQNYNSRIEERLELSRGCLMVLMILILIVIFKEEILRSDFIKSFKSTLKIK